MPRLPPIDPSSASPRVAEALEALPPLSIFTMVANAQTAFPPWLDFGAALLADLELDPRLRQLAILEVARLSDCEYEWVQHAAIALALGVGADEVQAVRRGDAATLDEDASAVVLFTRDVVWEVRAGDTTLATLRRHLPPRQVVELLLVIGHYMAIARVVETCGIPVDAPVQLAVVDAAAGLRKQP